MIDKETYKKELMRMFAWVRDDDTYNMKECSNFKGKNCNECPIRKYCFVFKFVPNKYGMTMPYDAFEVIEAVERWSKEHPPKKFKVSKLEYDIMRAAIDYNYSLEEEAFKDVDILYGLLINGYFEGAKSSDKVIDFFKNCEVLDDDD